MDGDVTVTAAEALSEGCRKRKPRSFAEEQAKLIETQLATKIDLELLKHDLTVRVGGMMMALGGILVAIRFLGH